MAPCARADDDSDGPTPPPSDVTIDVVDDGDAGQILSGGDGASSRRSVVHPGTSSSSQHQQQQQRQRQRKQQQRHCRTLTFLPTAVAKSTGGRHLAPLEYKKNLLAVAIVSSCVNVATVLVSQLASNPKGHFHRGETSRPYRQQLSKCMRKADTKHRQAISAHSSRPGVYESIS